MKKNIKKTIIINAIILSLLFKGDSVSINDDYFDLYENTEELETVKNPQKPQKYSIFKQEIGRIVQEAKKDNNIQNKVGIYIKELSTNYVYSENESLMVNVKKTKEAYFRAASVSKLPMAFLSYKLIERGVLKTDKAYIDSVTGKTFYILPTLKRMIIYSDNDCYNIMLRLIGRNKLNNLLKEYGISNSRFYGEINPSIGFSISNNLKRHKTSKSGGRFTPKDTAVILEKIYNQRKKNNYMKLLNQHLLKTVFNSRIPAGISKRYPVAHKTGTAEKYGVYNDVGIIYCKSPYIIVIFTKGEKKEAAEGFIKSVSKEITYYINN